MVNGGAADCDCCCQLLNCASHTSIGGEAGQRTHYWPRLDGPGTNLGQIGPARICLLLDVLQIGGGGGGMIASGVALFTYTQLGT